MFTVLKRILKRIKTFHVLESGAFYRIKINKNKNH